MKKELTRVEKSRTTRLSKKSVEELVGIILRKDAVEKALSDKLRNSEKNYANLSSTYDDALSKVYSLQEKVENSRKYEHSLREELDKVNTAYNKRLDSFNRADAIVARCKIMCAIAVVVAVIMCAIAVFAS